MILSTVLFFLQIYVTTANIYSYQILQTLNLRAFKGTEENQSTIMKGVQQIEHVICQQHKAGD